MGVRNLMKSARGDSFVLEVREELGGLRLDHDPLSDQIMDTRDA
jgi:hypothetical protein